MKFARKEEVKSSRFIKFNDEGVGVYARLLTETEKDKIHVKARRVEVGEVRTPELEDRKFKILYLQEAISDWEGMTWDDGTPIPYTKEVIKDLWEVNPIFMNLIFNNVANEFVFAKEEEEKNSEIGQTE